MLILTRYIQKHVIYASCLIAAVVLGLGFIIGFLGEFKDIGSGDYGFWQALCHVVLLLPQLLYQFFPMLILLGGVLGLSVLAGNYELTVIRAAGFSTWRVVGAVLKAALVLVLFVGLIGETIAPRAYYLANKQKIMATSRGQMVATRSGVWLHDGNNFIHIERIVGNRYLQGITRYEFADNDHLQAAYYAKSADYTHNQWLVHDIKETRFAEDKTQSSVLLDATWDLRIHPNLLQNGAIEPESMSLKDLRLYAEYLKENRLEAGRFQLEFWRRLFQPLTSLVMILLAIPFVFVAPRSMTLGRRIVVGVMLGFVFYILNAFLGELSIVVFFPPLLAALLPTVFFALLILLLLWRKRSYF